VLARPVVRVDEHRSRALSFHVEQEHKPRQPLLAGNLELKLRIGQL